MKQLSTIQKRNNLNEVYRCGNEGPGGAYHEYEIFASSDLEGEGTWYQLLHVCFQEGPRGGASSTSGVLDGDLLEIVRDRLACFQAGAFATRENACALHHIEEALMWMNKRTEDRAERNVLGTYQK